MHRLTHRSDFNRGNMGRYSRLDQAIDRAKEGQRDITPVIGRCEEPDHKPAPRPLRERLGDRPSTTTDGFRVRVYAHSETGARYVGLALSEETLSSLIVAGYLQADQVRLKGRMYGEVIEQQYTREEVA